MPAYSQPIISLLRVFILTSVLLAKTLASRQISNIFACVCRQCSECDTSESEEEMEVDVGDNTPISQSRQRRTIKEPTKFTPDKGEVS